ncbi:MAG: hypothetical protein R3B70_26835 [Polyangiaceae bacterium]
MGFFDKAKRLFGLSGSGDEESAREEESGGEARAPGGREPREEDPRLLAAERAGKLDPRRRDRRPPLVEAAPQGPGVEDALALREAGNKGAALAMLREIDKGGGLRTVLRAAAAMEAGESEEVERLLPVIAKEEPRYKLLLQVAGALGDAKAARGYIERAEGEKAPAWALGWAKATSEDAETVREGLVEMVFADHALARTVAARDLHMEGVEADADAGARYAAFVHGRESIRRFGARQVAALLDEARKVGGA